MRRTRNGQQNVALIDLEARSPRWLDFAAASSIALGIAELVVGAMGNSNALLSNAVENLDNITYAADAVAARKESNRKRNHRLRRFAGGVICAASLSVMGHSSYDLATHQAPEQSSADLALAGTALALNLSFVKGLRKDAQKGTTHRDAYRHAVADTASSAVAVGSLAASSSGHPVVDGVTGLALGTWTIIMTFPTPNRIKAADCAFAAGEDLRQSIEISQPGIEGSTSAG